MLIKQLSVFLENKPGTLAELTELLAEKKINLRALSVADSQDFGVVRIITPEPEQALLQLKEEGYICLLSDVLAVTVDDTPGALSGILNVLGKAGSSIEYTYASLSPEAGRAFLILRVQDNAKAEAALQAAGIGGSTEALF